MRSQKLRRLISLLSDEKAGALPSVLFLLAILYTAALSVVVLIYLNAQMTNRDIAKVKADYASQSGIASELQQLASASDASNTLGQRMWTFDEGSQANVVVQEWGIYHLLRSEGQFHKTTTLRTALVGELLSKQFDNALLYTNADHQLVLAGSTSIKGNVLTGVMGISTGTLKDRTTPRSLPIDGNTKKDPAVTAFKVSRDRLVNQIQEFDQLLKSFTVTDIPEDAILRFSVNGNLLLMGDTIPNNIRFVLVRGNAKLGGQIVRRDQPLTIVVDGTLTFQKDCQLKGFIEIVDSKNIVVPAGVSIDDAILYSQAGIVVENSANMVAQLFADSIVIKSGATLRYPSVVATVFGPGKATLQIENGARIEGAVLSFSSNNQRNPSLVNIEPGAKVTGAVYAEDRLTFDGSVVGIVIAKDFYFYESPTTYLGWIRSGTIDRTALPKSFLLPFGFSASPEYEVLDWL